MEIVIAGSALEAGIVVADAIEQTLQAAERPVIGLATGGSPLPAYRELIRRCNADQLSFADAQAVLLDEYVGLERGHPQRFQSFITREFTDHVDLPADALAAPHCPQAAHAEAAAHDYERHIADVGGVDVQLLGIGRNGHIGFNEPPSSLASRTRLKTLTAATRHDNARYFDDDPAEVPRHALTQGIGTILQARQIVLIATGENKSEAVANAVEGPITAMVPASALQLHPNTMFVVDEAAAQQLQHADYYRETYRHKPTPQQSSVPVGEPDSDNLDDLRVGGGGGVTREPGG